MSEAVLDASAVLAVLYQERGANELMEMLSREGMEASISSVNLCEVLTRLMWDGVAEEDAVRLVQGLNLNVHAFDEKDALTASRLHARVSFAGLSLGDRTCLALAQDRKAPVWTADRAWGKLTVGVEINLIRV